MASVAPARVAVLSRYPFVKLDDPTLTFTVQPPDTLVVTSPLNGNEAPPGYYMLFVVTNAGVPSKAAWIKLDPNLT